MWSPVYEHSVSAQRCGKGNVVPVPYHSLHCNLQRRHQILSPKKSHAVAAAGCATFCGQFSGIPAPTNSAVPFGDWSFPAFVALLLPACGCRGRRGATSGPRRRHRGRQRKTKARAMTRRWDRTTRFAYIFRHGARGGCLL